MKYAGLILVFLCGIADAPAAEPEKYQNQIRLQVTRKPAFIIGRAFNRNGQEIFKVTQNTEEAPFADMRLVDIDGDGLPEIETTGQCGQSCVHDIYKMAYGRYSRVFSGSYTSVYFLDHLYIFRENGGCCLENVHIYKHLTSPKRKSDYSFSMTRDEEEGCKSDPKILPARIAFLSNYLCRN